MGFALFFLGEYNLKKLIYTVANPAARGLLNREERTKENVQYNGGLLPDIILSTRCNYIGEPF